MKEKVLSLAKGNFIYEKPTLVVTPTQLTGEIEAGATKKFTIEVTNEKKTRVKGFGSTSEPEVFFLPVFNAERNELEVEFSAANGTEGSTMKGEISLVTDCGEAQIPYEIKVISPKLIAPSGELIDNYYKLQHLIKNHPQEGMELFRSQQFKDVFLYQEEEAKIVYDHLLEKNTRAQGAEEFMVAMGKKDIVCFQATHLPSGSSEYITYDLNGNDIYDSIKLTVNTIGNIDINVSTTADFVELETHTFHTEEFEKNSDIIEYRICMDKVPEGIHRGAIVIESVYQRQVIEVEAHNVILERERAEEHELRKAYAALIRDILAYRENRMAKSDFRQMLQEKKTTIFRLFPEYATEVEGYLAVELRDEKEILAFFQKTEGIQPPALDGTMQEVERYLVMEYIKYLYTKREEDAKRLAMLVEGYEEHGFESTASFVIRMNVDEKFKMTSALAASIKEKVQKGNNSPFLYSVLMQCYEQSPSLLKELGREELLVLRYGAQHGLISPELSVNISFLAQTLKGFNEILFAILTSLYQKYNQIDTLVVICEMIIRNARRGKKYFPWLECGVNNHLRITELFEYYMYAMDGDEIVDLPESVIAYFQFENHLTDRCKGRLYSYILRNKLEKPSYYNMYWDNIRAYALDQLKRHRINRELGKIYDELLREIEWTKEIAADIPYVMFTRLVKCDSDQMDSVVVVHPEIKEEIIYQIRNRKAHIQVYTPDAILMFVDKKGHYHCGTVSYTAESLLPVEDYAEKCFSYGSEHVGLFCYIASKAMKQGMISEEQARALEMVRKNEYLRAHAVGVADVRLYDYYRSVEDEGRLLEILDTFSPKEIKKSRLAEFATACIYHGLYEKAEKIFIRYGVTECEDKALLMLLQQRIKEKNNEFSPVLLKWTEQLYRHGVWDKCVLDYLLSYYMGATDMLTEIYMKSKEIPEFVMDDACGERLLGQVLFAGVNPTMYEELFHEYYDHGKNRVLVKAFLSYYAYEYLMERISLSDDLLKKIEKEALYVKDDVMVLATLYHLTEVSELTEKQRDFAEIGLEKYVAEGRIFRFMKKLKRKVELPYEIENSRVVEYRSATTQSVYLHITDANEKETVVPMKKIFDGVYSYPMLLFEGEHLRLRIREEETGEKTKPFVLHGEKAEDHIGPAGSFYQMMNRVIHEEKRGDTGVYKELQKEYETCRMAADHLFQIL